MQSNKHTHGQCSSHFFKVVVVRLARRHSEVPRQRVGLCLHGVLEQDLIHASDVDLRELGQRTAHVKTKKITPKVLRGRKGGGGNTNTNHPRKDSKELNEKS